MPRGGRAGARVGENVSVCATNAPRPRVGVHVGENVSVCATNAPRPRVGVHVGEKVSVCATNAPRPRALSSSLWTSRSGVEDELPI